MNNTKTVYEMEQELVKARQAIDKKVQDDLVQSFTSALDGKYFLSHWRYRDGLGVAVENFSKFKCSERTAGMNTEHRIEMTVKRVTINKASSKKTRRYSEPVGILRSVNEYESASNLYDVTRNHIREITKEQFTQIWDEAGAMVESRLDKWKNLVGLQFNEYPEVDAVAEIDFPFVQLSGGELYVVNGSPYLIPGDRHLITPGAKAYVMARIRDEQNRDARCAHLYEECDRGYVENLRATHARLIEKFGK
jgi:hypothetical protein